MGTRVVLDANQFISAVLVPVGHPAQILAAWRQGDLDILVSPPILAEVRRVLLYPRLQRRHGWDETQVDVFLEGVWAAAIPTPGTTAIEDVPDDPSDNKYLACALEGSAQYLITGDQHLLRLDPWRGIHIIPPAVFLETVLKRELHQ
jgi:putative PIN family toxin of toxin-antitoxin system